MTAFPLSDLEYHQLATRVLDVVESQIDQWLDQDVVDIDTHRTGGLLELSFENGSKMVLNTQPPLQEIWLAAKGGGYHYRHELGRWVDTRDGTELFASLSQHASAQSGRSLIFQAP
ncbi:iron donor protein CyaY [Ideonella sp. B7]|uniref:iron donor protein CyaY n=1 Tax=Ideonella benzenivorans TaxID=2831643 RepID=UPI001CED22F0|nr:iron donor protein CyaY [Ideonella benzenivorans]MCA6218708.1 iron donor protein CyaY [Ideonella benzenivorans]